MIEEIRRRIAEYQPQFHDVGERREAAVLLALYPRDGELHVILTARSMMVEGNRGQISFPGGGREPDDIDGWATALRESFEEIGLQPEHVKLIGRLDDYTGLPARYHISLFIAEIDEAMVPYQWHTDPMEVAEVLEVPLRHFLDKETRVDYVMQRGGEEQHMPAVRFGEHIIWGATFIMISHFLAVAVLPHTEPSTLA